MTPEQAVQIEGRIDGTATEMREGITGHATGEAGSTGRAEPNRATGTVWRLTPRAQTHANVNGVSGIILDTHNGNMCRCNETAWCVVNVLKSGPDVEQIIDVVMGEFDVARSDAETDTLEFLWQLKRAEFADEC